MNGPNNIPKNFPIEKPKSNMLKTFGEKTQTPSFWFAFQKIGKSLIYTLCSHLYFTPNCILQIHLKSNETLFIFT